jgi:ABC-2 type transport system ATP-binding protein
VLEAVHVTHRYGDVLAVDDVSLAVAPGAVVGFVGPNGAGKTTTLRVLAGITVPHRGEVHVDGRLAGEGDRRGFGYLPEQRGLYVRMRVREHLVYLARLRGLDCSAAEAAATTWMRRLGLSGRAEDRIQDLSHGNQQRVQLAAALVHEPAYLLFDEPFNGLDPTGVALLSELLQERAEAGAAVLLSSHQLDLVESLCDSVSIIDRGRIVASGTLAELASASQRRLVVEVDGAGLEWAPRVRGATVLEADGSRVRLLLADDADPQEALAAAMRAGRVIHFAVERPRLSEIFLQAVADSAPAAALGAAA